MSLELKIAFDRYVGGFLIFWLNIAARLLGFTLHRNHGLRVEGDILVVKMLGGGSLVMAFPALLGLRKKYSNVRMRLFTTASVKPFAETLGIFDDILVLDDSSFTRMLASGVECLRGCFGSDTVIDLEIYSYLSTVLSLLTFARNRIGFFFDETGFRQRLHTHRIFFNPTSALYLHYDRMANLLEAPLASLVDCTQHIRKVLGIDATGTLHSEPKQITIGCGCSDLSSERKLAPQQWKENVFDPCPSKDHRVIFLGAKGDYAEADKIIALHRRDKNWSGDIENACGKMSLKDSLKVLAASEEFWGIESSLLHYARLLGIKCKAFLGPTNPIRLRPFPGLQEEIFYRKTICSPCIHLVSKPPCHGHNVCMQWLFEPRIANDPREHWIPVMADTPRTDRSKL